MAIPKNLQHKPIIAVDKYDTIDGHYAPNTDARALSIGEAQYGKNEISAKVLRHTGKNWSRQSEELPIHRTLDLAILIVASMLPPNKDEKSVSQRLGEKIVDPDKYQILKDYYKTHDYILKPRLDELKDLLNTLIP
ncbi:DUF6530 family protein [Flavobacterium aquidurense]|uniref:DUF6530 family protein n=1 Tax=Flavobacterium aquidurense TaxID=362413 RepID=UPI0028593147|nr:DUF6530 family protein [Flavobacterium aquidurense]MDR7371082.1 hypothetical protein [Flavobacterium aquidurense]